MSESDSERSTMSSGLRACLLFSSLSMSTSEKSESFGRSIPSSRSSWLRPFLRLVLAVFYCGKGFRCGCDGVMTCIYGVAMESSIESRLCSPGINCCGVAISSWSPAAVYGCGASYLLCERRG